MIHARPSSVVNAQSNGSAWPPIPSRTTLRAFTVVSPVNINKKPENENCDEK